MRTRFYKMHGAGNDFVLIDRLGHDAGRLPDARRRRELADRHTGIGYDQMLVIDPPQRDGTDAFIRIFNADGNEAAQCGNGLRCITLYLSQLHGRDQWQLDGVAGVISARTETDGSVSVSMGVPRFGASATGALSEPPYQIGATTTDARLVSMGNPHAVINVEQISDAPVAATGSALQAMFSDGVNVGFAQRVSADHLALRVWERGVGETQACGTGACAAAVTAIEAQQFVLSEVTVDLPGGQLMVKWAGQGQVVWLRGPAQQVFQGHFSV